MESVGLNNLEQYFTIIYTMSFPRHILYCFYYCTKSQIPSCMLQSFVGSLLNSGSCPKCIRSWCVVGCIFKKLSV